jgi:hypothetical protein
MKKYNKTINKKSISESETETETETKTDTETKTKSETKTKNIKKLKKDIKSKDDSETETDTETKTESDTKNKKKLKKDIKSKKETKKKQKMKQKMKQKNEKFDNLLKNKFEYINSHIEKYENITSKNISDLIKKFYDLPYTSYESWNETQEAYDKRIKNENNEIKFAISSMEKIIDMKYNLSEDDNKKILSKFPYEDKYDDLSKILLHLKFKDFDSLSFYAKHRKYNDGFLKYINLEPYGKDKINENLSYLYTITENIGELEEMIKDKKVIITENHLKYAKTSRIKKFISKNISKEINIAKKIEVTNIDYELLKCSSIEEIDDFINENNYKLSPQVIVLACQQNLNFDLITHLVSCKINFDEDKINQLIQSYRDNENISKLLILIHSYGYKFTKSSYIEMLSSKHYASIFGENLGNNLVIDEQFVEYAYNSFVLHDLLGSEREWNNEYGKTNVKSIESFLKNIEIYGEKNKQSAEGILALHCSVIFKFGNDIIKKIKNLKQKYNVKLNNLCLKYLFKNKSNTLKNIIDIFKKDKVVPDLESSNQYILTTATPKFAEIYNSLLIE